jgi:hypothetical protein
MVASMWAEEVELQGRTSRPRIVSPARQQWATPDTLDGIRMWHDDQPSDRRRGVPSSRSQAEASELPAKHAAALVGRLRPVDIGVGALGRSDSITSPERAVGPESAAALPESVLFAQALVAAFHNLGSMEVVGAVQGNDEPWAGNIWDGLAPGRQPYKTKALRVPESARPTLRYGGLVDCRVSWAQARQMRQNNRSSTLPSPASLH